MTVTLHVINHTGDQLGVYALPTAARIGTVTSSEACIAIPVNDSSDIVLGFKRTAEHMIYAQPTAMAASPWWEIVIERSTLDGTVFPYQVSHPCR